VGASAKIFGARLWKLQKNTCASAAGGGHLEVLRWLRRRDCPWDPLNPNGGRDCCAYAAEGGHLEVLQWARGHGCPWDDKTCAGAARGGHLEVLQWARERDCPWDWETCENAWTGVHLAVLKWARENGCEEFGRAWQKPLVGPGRHRSKRASAHL
jgi:hypothetical protein